MMRSTLFALMFATSAVASRIQVHEADDIQALHNHRAQTEFGRSCETLQQSFKVRLDAFQDFLDANPDLDAIGRAAQARTMLRTYGIIRTLRRARTCQWVIDNDSEDLERARSIVQTLLAGSPCAGAARAELQAGASAESGELEMQSIQRAMVILNSDNCAAPEQAEEPTHIDENEVEAELVTAEDEVQDAIEELEDSGDVALLQMHEGTVNGFFRAIGVAVMFIFLLLACVGAVVVTAAVIGVFISMAYFQLAHGVCAHRGCQGWRRTTGIVLGGGAGALVGIAPCAYQLYTQLLQ